MVRRSMRQYVFLYASLLALLLVLAACGGRGEAARPTLTVTKAGTGGGTVMGADINCGDDCTGSYTTGTTVTLTATPDSGSVFTGWSGDCSGDSCDLTMDSDKAVTATFDAEPPAPQGKELSGTAEGWTGQDAVMRAETYGENGEDYIVVATSPVAEDGSFNLSLPGEEGISAALVPVTGDCEPGEGTLEVTPDQFDLATISLWAYPADAPETSGEDFLGLFSYSSEDGAVQVEQFYASSDASIQGNCTRTGTYEDPETGELVDYTDFITYDLDLVAGWNDVVLTFEDTSDTTLNLNVSTGDVPEGLTWQYFEDIIFDEENVGTSKVVPSDLRNLLHTRMLALRSRR